MEQSVDQIAFYVISLFICIITLLTKFLGHKKAITTLASVVIVMLLVFLLFGVVAKDIHGVALPMKEITIIFFGFLKALFPLVWLVGLLSLTAENKTKYRRKVKAPNPTSHRPPQT